MTDTDTTTAHFAAAGQPHLNAALAALQANLPAVAKTKRATVKGTSKDGGRVEFSYAYADLADVSAVLLPLLGKVGLAFTASPTLTPAGQFVLSYSLLHASGEHIDGSYPLPSPDRASPTAIGSAVTYARRYALCAISGCAAEEDDDAQAAGTGPVRTPARRPDPRPLGPPPERPPAALPRNADGSLSRSQATDPELAAAGVMTSGQVKDHTALRNGAVNGHAPPGKVTRATAADPDDPWAQGPQETPPLRVPSPAHPPRATGGQAGIIVRHFARLGFDEEGERGQRLAATAALAGITRDIATTRDLSQDEAHRVSETLSRCRDRDALVALLVKADARAEVPVP
jgi:hypothetical protein